MNLLAAGFEAQGQSWYLVLALAGVIGVLKGITYFLVFLGCSLSALPAGKRLDRAFHGTVARTLLGVFSTPLFLMVFVPFSEARINETTLVVIHQAVRLVFWLGVVLFVYRKAAFHSPAHRVAFVLGVVVAGTMVNLAWDQLLFEGTPLKTVNSKWC